VKFKKTLKITSRTSSVTNGFVQAIIPCIEPRNEEMIEALAVLGMTPDNVSCVYCGASATDWDHLRPLVKAKRPTGYATDIRNLVPACGPCNQSKGGQDWRTWMLGYAKGSPRVRGISNIEEKAARLEEFERWSEHAPLDFRELVGAERWDSYWHRLETIERQMFEAQAEATQIRESIATALLNGPT
jgi:hypothetical protein